MILPIGNWLGCEKWPVGFSGGWKIRGIGDISFVKIKYNKVIRINFDFMSSLKLLSGI